LDAAEDQEPKEDYSDESVDLAQAGSWVERGEHSGIEEDLLSVAGMQIGQEEQTAQEGLVRHKAVRVKRMVGNQTDLAGRVLEVLHIVVRRS